MPPKDAGVGLARKIGMDEALMRLASQNQNGGIVCLDADCAVAPNYLSALEAIFVQNLPPASVSIYFEHPFPSDPILREGIVQYELFLRYYVAALCWAGYPYAFHTVGSSMAVRADVYARSGGMNRRKAGEDFYFLHKIASLGAHYALCHTTVYPSPRVSHRVPFGTGKAQEKWLRQNDSHLLTYPLAIFEDLSVWLSQIKKLYPANETQFEAQYEHWPEGIRHFFPMDKFWGIHYEVRQKSSTEAIYFKHLFARLDGLQVLKLVHFLRDSVYGEAPLVEAAGALARQLGGLNEMPGPIDLLHWYRQREKNLRAKT
ncbi:MAG: family 2 glycosyl transferase [Microscillaceae bacterium]|nr:family 2 glycosyl transferase [Microscillaceae bacterium]